MIKLNKLIWFLLLFCAACTNTNEQPQSLLHYDSSLIKLNQEGNLEESNMERYILTFSKHINEQIIVDVGGEILEKADSFPIVTVLLSPSMIQELRQFEEVRSIEKDRVVDVSVENVDWGVENVKSGIAWQRNYKGDGIRIAVLDTGVDRDHPDLSVSGGTTFVPETTTFEDDNGHGTHVFGVIGAQHNELGITGIAPRAELFAIKVMNSNGEGLLSYLISGIDWSIKNNMDIINLSLGFKQDSTVLRHALKVAQDQGIVSVAAVGNTGTVQGMEDNVEFPARLPSTIGVGAINQQNTRATFSSTGPDVEIVAPGTSIVSTYLNGSYAKISGTSMASPHVTGTLALLMQANPNASIYELRMMLQQNGIDLGPENRDTYYGFGKVQFPTVSFVRFGGQDRFEVETNLNRTIPYQSLDSILIASGLNFPDALTGGILHNKKNSTLLLVKNKESLIEAKVNQAKSLLKPGGKVYILGGQATVSTTIEDKFRQYFEVERLSGQNRIEVSTRVAEEANSSPTEVFLSYGLVFSDSLSIVPVATKYNIPIILQYGKSLREEVKKYIKSNPSITNVTIVSGVGVIPVSIENELKDLGVTTVERVAGKDRYETSLAIAKKYFPSISKVALSNGLVFADALSGNRFTYTNNMPILLVREKQIPDHTTRYFDNNTISNVYLFGGPATLHDEIKNGF